MKVIDILLTSKLFKGLSKGELQEIFEKLNYKIRRYAKKTFIFDAEDICDQLVIVLDGELELQKTMFCGKFYNLNYLKNGDVFGLGTIFSDSDFYQMDVIAKTYCTILLISEFDIRHGLFVNDKIIQNMMKIMGNKIINLTRRVELFSSSSIKRRIAYSLLNAKNNFESCQFCLPINKKEWAEHLNVSRTSLLRELKDLGEKGVISVSNKKIVILNPKYLENIL